MILNLRRLLLVLVVLLVFWAIFIFSTFTEHHEVVIKAQPLSPEIDVDLAPASSIVMDETAQEAETSIHSANEIPKHSIHFITVQTNPTPGWCRNMNSARKTGISVTSLGWGQSYSHVIRPSWIVSFLQRTDDTNKLIIHPDDVILFSDGSDTMFTGVSPEHILARYEYIAQSDFSGRRDFVMFNAEANCFHQQLFPRTSWGVMKGRCISVYKAFDPQIRTKWRYLNAGAWIATARAATWWFGNASAKIAADKSKYWWCDQSLIGGMMLEQTKDLEKYGFDGGDDRRKKVDRSKFLAVLDTKNSIFLPTYHFRVKDDVCSRGGSEVADSNFASLFHHPPKLVLCHSNRAPAVLHFNGKSGNSGIEAEKRVEFPRSIPRRSVGGGAFAATILTWDTKSKKAVAQDFSKMCPKYS